MSRARVRARSAPQTRQMPPLRIHVTTWADRLAEERGYPALSMFVEVFWLPVLGPSAMFLFRRLNLLLEARPDGVTLDMNELGGELGLGTSESRHAPLPRAISRLVRLGLAKRPASGQLAVRCAAGPLSQHLLNGLDLVLQEAHRRTISLERAGDPDLPAIVPLPTADPTGG
jgi:hypothetical protein